MTSSRVSDADALPEADSVRKTLEALVLFPYEAIHVDIGLNAFARATSTS